MSTRKNHWEYKKRALAGYEAGSKAYDKLYHEEQEKKYERCSQYFDKISDRLILDCGCGTGMLLKRLFRHRGLFVGVDYSKAMLDIARERIGSATNVDLICADVDSLPFQGGKFDKVVSFTMLGNMPNIASAIRELTLVARNSAEVVLSFVKKNVEIDEVLESLENARVRVKELISDCGLKDWIVIGEKISDVSTRHQR